MDTPTRYGTLHRLTKYKIDALFWVDYVQYIYIVYAIFKTKKNKLGLKLPIENLNDNCFFGRTFELVCNFYNVNRVIYALFKKIVIEFLGPHHHCKQISNPGII